MEEIKRQDLDRFFYWIRVRTETHLDDWVGDYFAGLEMKHEKGESTLLAGEMEDMPAVYGLILKIRDAGINLLSLHVERKERRDTLR